MLSSRYLVAPVMKKGCIKRQVVLPEGDRKLFGRDSYHGGQALMLDAPLDTLLFFKKE